MIEVELPDGRLVEVDTDDPGKAAAAARKFLTKATEVPVEKTMDKITGAPAAVRLAVGSAERPEDRLATLKQFYPDAQPFESDNFVYTDPKTERPTLYNPSGLDWGDLASITPEAAEYAAGTAAAATAAVGATATAPAHGGIGYLAVPAAYGLGAAGGREAAQLIGKKFFGTVDTRSLPQHLTDTATTAGVNAAAQRLGELGEAAVKKAFTRRIVPASGESARGTLQAFDEMGVRPSAGAVTGSRALQSSEQALANTPGGANTMQDLIETQIGQVKAATERLASQYGRTETQQGAGEVIRDGAKRAAERFTTAQGRLYDDAFAKVGDEAPVTLSNLSALRQQMEAELAQAPASLAGSVGKALKTIRGLEADAAQNGGAVPFAAFRQVRTNIGRDLDNPVLAGASSSLNTQMKRIYGALTADMKTAATSVSDDAARSLDVADRYTRFNMNKNIPILEKITKQGSDEAAFAWATAEGKAGGNRLAALRRNLTRDEWEVVAGTVLGRLGRAKPGAQNAAGDAFSVHEFVTNWAGLSNEAKDALFSGSKYAPLRDQLDQLAKVAASIKAAERMGNPSGTARVAAYTLLFSAIGGETAAAYSGGTGQGLGASALIGAVVAPKVAAKLITRPSFVRWLAEAPEAAARRGGSLADHIARLGTIAKVEPEIKEEIQQFENALRGAIPETGNK